MEQGRVIMHNEKLMESSHKCDSLDGLVGRFHASVMISNDPFWCWEGDSIYYDEIGANQCLLSVPDAARSSLC